MSAVTVLPHESLGNQSDSKKKNDWSLLFCRALGDVSTNQGAEGGDDGKRGTINSLTSLNVHLMMHT